MQAAALMGYGAPGAAMGGTPSGMDDVLKSLMHQSTTGHASEWQIPSGMDDMLARLLQWLTICRGGEWHAGWHKRRVEEPHAARTHWPCE
eukprot:1146558-Pelagomonas_calceolata.AAC.6